MSHSFAETDAMERIYAASLHDFAQVFDADFIGDDEMQSDVTVAFRSLVTYFDDECPALESADIRDIIREAGAELRIPSDWLYL